MSGGGEPRRRPAGQALASGTCAQNRATRCTRSLAAGGRAYPTRPVRVIVMAPAGGGYYIVARLMCPFLAGGLRVQIILENTPGAGVEIRSHTLCGTAADG